MTELPPPVLEAKKWCDEVRELLAKTAATEQRSKSLAGRVQKVLDELMTLRRAVQARHPEIEQQFVARFTTIARELRSAAATSNTELIDAETQALGQLKKDLRAAVQVAAGGTGEPAATASAHVQAYAKAYEPLAPRIAAARQWQDVSTRVRAALASLTAADTEVTEAAAKDPERALSLLASKDLAGLLDTAEKANAALAAAKSRFESIDAKVQTVLGWSTAALQPPLAGLQAALRTDYAPAAPKAAQHDHDEAVELVDAGDLAAKADTAIANKPLAETFAKLRPLIAQRGVQFGEHVQAKHAAAELQAARDHLAAADQLAQALRYQEANQRLAAAKKSQDQAKQCADDFAAFLVEYGRARAIILAFQSLSDELKASSQKVLETLESIRTDVDQNRSYDTGNPRLQSLFGKLRDGVAKKVTELTTKVQEVEALVAGQAELAAFIQPDLDQIEKLRLRIDADLQAERWAAALWEAQARAFELVVSAKKYVERRSEYQKARDALAPKLGSLKSDANLASRAIDMNIDLRTAEHLASREVLRCERARTILARLDAECTALLRLAQVAKDYATRRQAAETELARLEQEPAAPSLQDTFARVRSLLADATAATAADDGDPEWAAGLGFVASAATELAAAGALCQQLADTMAAQQMAGAAKDAQQLAAAIATLQQRAVAAGKRAHADLVGAELQRATTALATAAAKAKGDELPAAAQSLGQAAAELTTAETVQFRHADCVALRDGIEKRQEAVPTPDKVAAKLQETAKALQEAAEAMAKREYDAARASLHRAGVAVAAAEAAAASRKAFDERAERVAERHRAMAADAAKDAVGKVLAEAARHASEFTFDRADKALDRAESQMDVATMAALAKADPNDATILDRAQQIVDRGDAAQLDKLIAELPADASLSLLDKLAQKRFGCSFAIEVEGADADAGPTPEQRQQALASAKKMWQMFAKVPGDSRNNPSLKAVRRTKPGEDGGFYRSSEDLVVMHGRPARTMQKFGKNLATELPKDIDDIYQPVNDDDIDYFDFATLHEVGHAVDDQLGFMSRREGDENFGGWRNHGGDVRKIAQAVVDRFGFDVDYVEGKILGAEPPVPKAPDDVEASEWEAQQRRVDAWHAVASSNGIWWNNDRSTKIELGGRVYQQAYPKTWVSYSLKARSRGLTGYQFRAPGEWFAELYAAYHSGKLKKSHPAARWLSEIGK